MMERQNDSKNAVAMVFCTFPNRESACQTGTVLLESQVVACVSIVPGVESIYRWKGEIQRENEVLVMLKTTREKLDDLEAALQNLHPYDVPEIIALPLMAGAKSYLDWVRNEIA